MGEQTQISYSFFVFGTLALLMLAVAVVLFFFNYQRKIHQQQEQEHLLQKAYQRQLFEAVIETQEKEQQRIGRDLHDGIGVFLSLIKLQLNNIPRNTTLPAEAGDQITELSNKLTEAIQGARKISHNLMPATVEQFGLVESLRSLLKEVAATAGIDTDLYADDLSAVSLPDSHEIALYRVVQELVQNSLKHGMATEIRLDMQLSDGLLLLVYQDNGVGCHISGKTDREVDKKGIGLKNIEGRITLLNGVFEIDSAPGKGFNARAEIPVAAVPGFV